MSSPSIEYYKCPTTKKKIRIIDDENFNSDWVQEPKVGKRKFAKGQEERDYSVHPESMFASPGELDLLSDTEIVDRIKENEAHNAVSRYLRKYYKSKGKNTSTYSQNGQGFCWKYSGERAAFYAGLRSGQFLRTNPHAGATIIKNGRDQGGWCGEGAMGCIETGMCPEGPLWPGHSYSMRNVTAKVKEAMAKYKLVDQWMDLTKRAWDHTMTMRQIHTCLAMLWCIAGDFNWWGHSVCLVDVVILESGSLGLWIDNSWTDGWENEGSVILRGTKARVDGAVGIRQVSPMFGGFNTRPRLVMAS